MDIAKMARWLPLHRDRYYLNLGAAAWGQYKPQYKPDEHSLDPEAVKSAANRELDAFSHRADAAMRAFQAKKAGRR